MSDLRKVIIDGEELEVPAAMTVLQACEEAGKEIPRFCYHERLSIAGNCRMCLVEWVGAPKPQASCALSVGDLRPDRDGTPAKIRTDSEVVKKAREGVMEFLLINHPLDCPICDQGGECDLQDEAVAFGRGSTRFHENKRAVREKYMGPLIKTVMTRCIHCTRCVRFAEEVAGVEEIGAVNRGENMEITSYLEKAVSSELSANVIDLCPVGALTSKPYAFKARSWELRKTETIDVMDAVGSNIRVDARGNEVMRVLPRLNEDVNEEWISNKTRYACDGLTKRRLDRPYVRKDGKLQEASWAEAFKAVKAGLSGLKGEDIAAFAGDLQDVESMFALKSLMNTMGVTQTESRLDGAALDASDRSSYLFNSTISGIEDADFCLLIGANPKLEATIVNARLRKAVVKNGLKVARIGAAGDLTYPVQDLGNDASVLSDIASGKHDIAKALKDAKRPMVIIGMGALTRADGAAILSHAMSLDVQREDWNGFNILHTAASRVGALDLGFVSETEIKAPKAVYLLGADEVAEAHKDAFLVYQGTHGDEAVNHADVILPGAAYTEKSGLYVNMEGRVQLAPRAVFPVGDAREDWTIIRALSDVLGHTLPFDDLADLRAKLVEAHPHFAEVDMIATAEWHGVDKPEGKIEAGEFSPVVENYYLTNPIARASETMDACVREILGQGEQEEATGTHG